MLIYLEYGLSHMEFPSGVPRGCLMCSYNREKARELAGVSFIRALSPFMGTVPSCPSDLNTFQHSSLISIQSTMYGTLVMRTWARTRFFWLPCWLSLHQHSWFGLGLCLSRVSIHFLGFIFWSFRTSWSNHIKHLATPPSVSPGRHTENSIIYQVSKHPQEQPKPYPESLACHAG